MVHNTVTDKKRAANRSNGAQSRGPSTEEGKERAKMNAFKHGRDAARPDAADLLGADLTEPEAAEREALRDEARRCYAASAPASTGSASGPASTGSEPADGPDSFAAAEATELADLRYELVRLGRVRALARQREQELLELEECRRRVQRYSLLQATTGTVIWNGLLSLPDSPAKWREVAQEFGLLAEQFARHEFDDSTDRIRRLYGIDEHGFEKYHNEEGYSRERPGRAELWRGEQMRGLAVECRDLGEGAEFDVALGRLQGRVAEEREAAKAGLELAELEFAPLTEVGQSARLEEALASRRWSWIRQQENFLRREIDRKVRILVELRRQADRKAREAQGSAGFQPAAPAAPGRQGSGVGEGAPTPARDATPGVGFEAASGEASATPRHDGDGEKKSAKRRNEPTKPNKINNAIPTPDGPGSEHAATSVPPEAASTGPEGA